MPSDPIGKSIPDLPHTPANAQLYDAIMVVVSQKLGGKCTVHLNSGPIYGVRIHYAIRSPTTASLHVMYLYRK